jgi:hypothetical protein
MNRKKQNKPAATTVEIMAQIADLLIEKKNHSNYKVPLKNGQIVSIAWFSKGDGRITGIKLDGTSFQASYHEIAAPLIPLKSHAMPRYKLDIRKFNKYSPNEVSDPLEESKTVERILDMAEA